MLNPARSHPSSRLESERARCADLLEDVALGAHADQRELDDAIGLGVDPGRLEVEEDEWTVERYGQLHVWNRVEGVGRTEGI